MAMQEFARLLVREQKEGELSAEGSTVGQLILRETPEVGESKWAMPGARNDLRICFGRLGVHWVGGCGRYLERVSR